MKAFLDGLVRLVRMFLGILTGFLGTYYSQKYAALVRWLGLPRGATSAKKGFAIVQIDGLSHRHILEAMRRGHMPYLRRMLRRQGYVLRPWNSGLPATTPAVQAAIMFGDRYDIPAFRWYDKEAREPVVATTPSVAYAIQDRATQNGRSILRGGSSFMNMFDGGASLSMFTLGALNRKRFFESVRGFGFFLIFVLNPFRTLKVLGLVIWEHLTDLWQRTLARVRKVRARPLSRVFPFLRVISNVLMREVQTFCVMLDMYRGVSAIYTTYYGYDEVAHHYGSLAKPSFRALHAIDKKIKEIDAMRRLALNREYDLYILSDHGMTDAVPYFCEYGESLGETVRKMVDRSKSVGESGPWLWHAMPQALYLQEELEAIEENVAPPLAYIPRRLRRLLAKQMQETAVQPDQTPLDEQDVVVSSSGSMAHLYLNVRDDQLDLGEVAALAPDLISRLLSHPGIWLVIGRHQDDVMIMGENGMLVVGEDVQIEAENPLVLLPDSEWAARELARLTRYPHAGDLVIMGRYDSEAESVCCFERLWACHGGLGGPQTQSFLLAQKEFLTELGDEVGPEDIHAMFWKRYLDDQFSDDKQGAGG